MWYSTEDLENGINGMPKISKITQNNIRKNRLIQFTKTGRNVYYKKEWIEDYLNGNIRKAKTDQDKIDE